jgi:beta-lactamase class A
MRAFHKGKGLSESSQAPLLQLMTETTTGFKRIKGYCRRGRLSRTKRELQLLSLV